MTEQDPKFELNQEHQGVPEGAVQPSRMGEGPDNSVQTSMMGQGLENPAQ